LIIKSPKDDHKKKVLVKSKKKGKKRMSE